MHPEKHGDIPEAIPEEEKTNTPEEQERIDAEKKFASNFATIKRYLELYDGPGDTFNISLNYTLWRDKSSAGVKANDDLKKLSRLAWERKKLGFVMQEDKSLESGQIDFYITNLADGPKRLNMVEFLNEHNDSLKNSGVVFDKLPELFENSNEEDPLLEKEDPLWKEEARKAMRFLEREIVHTCYELRRIDKITEKLEQQDTDLLSYTMERSITKFQMAAARKRDNRVPSFDKAASEGRRWCTIKLNVLKERWNHLKEIIQEAGPKDPKKISELIEPTINQEAKKRFQQRTDTERDPK